MCRQGMRQPGQPAQKMPHARSFRRCDARFRPPAACGTPSNALARRLQTSPWSRASRRYADGEPDRSQRRSQSSIHPADPPRSVAAHADGPHEARHCPAESRCAGGGLPFDDARGHRQDQGHRAGSHQAHRPAAAGRHAAEGSARRSGPDEDTPGALGPERLRVGPGRQRHRGRQGHARAAAPHGRRRADAARYAAAGCRARPERPARRHARRRGAADRPPAVAL